MLKTAFDGNAMGRTQTFEWFPQYKRGETSVEHQEHFGYSFLTVRALFTRNLFLQAKR
jgi:hypothetical protein